MHGGEPSNKTGYATIGKDVSPGEVYRDSNVTVTAFEVAHGKWEHAYGYVFKTRDRTIVVSGDTRPSDAVVRACQQCDVLIHEVYDAESVQATPARVADVPLRLSHVDVRAGRARVARAARSCS